MHTRWGAAPFADYTNATHTGLIDLATRNWSSEVFAAAGLSLERAAKLTQPGARLGKLRGPLAELPALRDTELVAPACHDTASAIAGNPTHADCWAYISSGTWSLIGALLASPCNSQAALADNFTNLGAIGSRVCFHKAVNGMWLLKQCMDVWAAAGVAGLHRGRIRPPGVARAPRRRSCWTLATRNLVWSATCPRASMLSSGGMAMCRWMSLRREPRAWPHSSFTAWPPLTRSRLRSYASTRASNPPRLSSLVGVAATIFSVASRQSVPAFLSAVAHLKALPSATSRCSLPHLRAHPPRTPSPPRSLPGPLLCFTRPNPYRRRPPPHPHATPRTPEVCRSCRARARSAAACSACSTHCALGCHSVLFHLQHSAAQRAYDRALAVLAANVQVLPRFSGPVLIEGAEYAGIWQECGPHESLALPASSAPMPRAIRT